eukprot:5461632-Amphidinium_carterae.1
MARMAIGLLSTCISCGFCCKVAGHEGNQTKMQALTRTSSQLRTQGNKECLYYSYKSTLPCACAELVPQQESDEIPPF